MQTIKLIDDIIATAISMVASDIHFEPGQDYLRIRLRIDGVLQQQQQLPVTAAASIVSRLKILANLDIAEKRIPQDGNFTIKASSAQQRDSDCRVSTCPTIFGEKVVLRLLDPCTMQADINSLGLEDFQKQLFLQAIKQPQGIILVTGPTGSGKTITLYTALKLLNSPERNIVTCEDPVEMHLPGINQVNVHNKIGLDFSTALRAFLRQDPDIIMIGEIRDSDTAQIAFKAAQTGHLVLATLHSNDTMAAISRLMNLGIAKHEILAATILITAQRLVRKISNTGYTGRTGIFEMLPITAGVINTDLYTLAQAGNYKVQQNITTIEEIHRVYGNNNF
ncbi:MAG: Type 4 pili biogenesis protein pilB (nuleotide-binding protein) [Legionellales bacterium]|nr:MAG: Type 4 pili biogenesis protein pilB (nuleotide-binding protein) [Legionellales bacterium]